MGHCLNLIRAAGWAALAVLTSATLTAAAEPPGDKVAAAVNRSLVDETAAGDSAKRPASRCSDETFLRRVFLDLIGEPPTTEDVIAFSVDDDPAKRQKIVDKLLADESFGKNWGSYWRDVIMYRRSEDRALIGAASLTEFLTEQFNKNIPWNDIATAFITAEGDVLENGATGLIMAQAGRPEDTVAEISRIFMGIQIQCAQCHDHPTDRWKREQFHQLAAFFPRVAVRPNNNAEKRTFLVVVNDRQFSFRRPNANNRFRGTPEHRMPNLENPSEQGKLMQPIFFVNDKKLDVGTRDAQRRGALAGWVTSQDNPWFAKAFVNRLWSELVGEGFYEPVDDLGPDRDCSAPKTLSYLATAFAENGYDVKWLMKTIMSTDAYQRVSLPRRNHEQSPFAANCPQRLRGDQLYNTLKAALDFPEPQRRARGPYGIRGGPRTAFNQAFGYDPSQRREEIVGSIPQALLFMNSPLIAQSVNSRRPVGLGKMLRETDNDETLVTELYLKTLARQPSSGELKTCLSYVKEVGRRNEAFEDILWALINSTEFLHRK